MAELRTDPSSISSGGLVVNERAKEDYDESSRHLHHHHKETHGLRDDIDEETPICDVKAPNVFERAKEEIEAIVQAIHPKRDSARNEELKPENPDSHLAEKNSKSPNLFERAKEDIEALMHKQKSPHRHHKETHGTSDDIDENTPINEVKGPNVFQRAKEEMEAILDAIHLKKESDNAISSPKKEGGFGKSIGRGLEKVCSPGNRNRD